MQFQPSVHSRPNALPNTRVITPEMQAQLAELPSVTIDVREKKEPTFMSRVGKAVTLAGGATAMAVSYKRNRSIGWAFASSFVWPAYLIYTLVLDKEG